MCFKSTFTVEKIQLKKEDKIKQLNQIIIDYAKIAKEKRTSFEDLIRNTCLKKCLKFSTSLKYDPDEPNNQKNLKALIRIQ